MWRAVGTLLACLWRVVICQPALPSDLPQPPVMTIMPPKIVYYKLRETVMMPCKAHGSPNLEFTWKKDDIKFNPRAHNDRMVQLAREGTIVINFPELKDEGFYQCFVKNDYGIAMSSMVLLQPSRLEKFPEAEDHVYEKKRGESLTLPCIPPTSMPKGKVTWTINPPNRPFSVVQYDKHVTIDRDGNLHFITLQDGDDAEGAAYRCMVMNEFMRLNQKGEAHRIILKPGAPVEGPVTWMFNSQLEISAILGEDVSMKCVYGGSTNATMMIFASPTPTISWMKARGKIPEDRRQISSFGMELVILNVQWGDAGSYECRASNSAERGSQTRSFIVKVYSRPVWQSKPKDIETTVKRKANFLCSGRGDPLPEIVVRSNTVRLSENPGKAYIKEGSSGNLSYVSIEYRDLLLSDRMVLQCNVSNNYGFVFTNFILNVIEERPRFVRPPLKLVKVAETYPIRLFCQTSGKPDPVISWYKGIRPMTGGRYRIQRNGDLLIKRASLSDSGMYKCRAVNKFGSAEGSGRLIVRSKTKLVQKPMDIQVHEGKPAKFTCSATTDPLELSNLKIMWFKDNLRVLAESQRMTTNIQDNSLTVTDTIPRDSGRYSCIATNGIDNATAGAMLTVKGRPSKPTQMRVIKGQCLQRQVKLLWTAGSDNNAPISHYIVEYNTSHTPDLWVVANTGIRSNAVTLRISPWATYTFRVRAVNKIGESDPSDPTSRCITSEGSPDKNPENVRTIGDMKQHLVIEWTPMPLIHHNAPLLKYNVLYKKKGASKFIVHIEIDPKQSRFVKEVDDPRPYQPYEIQVIAQNSISKALEPPKTVLGFTGEGEPTLIPQNLAISSSAPITATSVTLEWDPVDTSLTTSINGEFRGYRVQYWKTNKKRTTFREQSLHPAQFSEKCPQGRMCLVLTQLIPFTYMEAQVVVINNFYMGPPSNVITFRTKEGLPGPVKSLHVLVAGPNHFRLKWEHPDEDDRNGIIIAYDIAYQTVDALVLGKLKDRDEAVKPKYDTASLSGLLPSQRYRVHIWAVTSKGRGEDHYIERNTTAAGTPDAPNFKFQYIGEHSMNISWRNYATSGKHAGSIFYVEYRKNGLSEWQKSPDEMVKYWANISSLESGTKYEVRLVTTNGIDYVPSAIKHATTSGVGAIHVASSNWFIGMLVIILLLIIAIIVIFVLVKYFDFTFDCIPQRESPKKTNEPVPMTHSGYRPGYRPGYHHGYHTSYQPGHAQREEAPPPTGAYSYYGNRDRYQRDSTDHRPPSYTSETDAYNAGEPDKFDSSGTPRIEIRDTTKRRPSYDEQNRYYDDDDDRRYYDNHRYDDEGGYDNRYYDDRHDDRGYGEDDYDREPRGGHTPTRSEGSSSFV